VNSSHSPPSERVRFRAVFRLGPHTDARQDVPAPACQRNWGRPHPGRL